MIGAPAGASVSACFVAAGEAAEPYRASPACSNTDRGRVAGLPGGFCSADWGDGLALASPMSQRRVDRATETKIGPRHLLIRACGGSHVVRGCRRCRTLCTVRCSGDVAAVTGAMAA